MAAEFVVYIDESGDEGFALDRGASSWFVLSAVIVPKEQDLETVKLLDDVRERIGVERRKVLHFRQLSHDKRLPYVDAISKAPVCVTTVLVHKPSIRDQETFSAPHRLYFYVARYLLERVSWHCRDHRQDGRSGSGHAEIIFSNRATMPYDDLRNYLHLLGQLGSFDRSVDPAVIRSEEISTYTPSKRMGLQLADAVATSFFYAVERNRHGYTEPRYATMLKPVVYCKGTNYASYGLKLMPTDCQVALSEDDCLDWMRKF